MGGFIWNSKLTNLFFLGGGTYLIAMNFFDEFWSKSIFGIICIIVPILIVRFSSEYDQLES